MQPAGTRKRTVAVVAVAVVVDQAFQRGADLLPVAPPARAVTAGLGAQQPAGVDPVVFLAKRPLAVRSGLGPLAGSPSPPAGTLASAVASRRPADPAGLVGDGGRGRRSRPPVPSPSQPNMLRWPVVVQAISAPIGVQFRGGH